MGNLSDLFFVFMLRITNVATSIANKALLSSPSSSASATSSARTAQIAKHFSTYTTPSNSSTLSHSPSTQHPFKRPSYGVRKVGAPNTLEYRVYTEMDGKPVSPFHDIPLYANEQQTILNMVVEIPRWTNAKLEVSSDIRRWWLRL